MKNHMKHILAATLFTVFAGPASAACYADYKAKRDEPLKLHYGVIEISDSACGNKGAAKKEIAAALKDNNWKLLNVLSTFDDSGLSKRKDSAGKFFLRF
jgi:hypothetical protein